MCHQATKNKYSIDLSIDYTCKATSWSEFTVTVNKSPYFLSQRKNPNVIQRCDWLFFLIAWFLSPYQNYPLVFTGLFFRLRCHVKLLHIWIVDHHLRRASLLRFLEISIRWIMTLVKSSYKRLCIRPSFLKRKIELNLI